jgi:hypothetical protein
MSSGNSDFNIVVSFKFIIYTFIFQPLAINIVSRLVPDAEFILPVKSILPLAGITDIALAQGSDAV